MTIPSTSTLERGGERIGIEVSVSTSPHQEVTNILKCLREGYDKVIVFVLDERKIPAIKNRAHETVDEEEQSKIFVEMIYDFGRFLL